MMPEVLASLEAEKEAGVRAKLAELEAHMKKWVSERGSQ